MKKIKLNASERMLTTEQQKVLDDSLSKNKSPKQEPGKTLDHNNSFTGLTEHEFKNMYYSEKAEILPESTLKGANGPLEAEKLNISNKIDEIIRNNDKFETINVIMKILCKELGIPEDSDSKTISEALKGVAKRYYKSMEEWRELNKSGRKQDIRQ